MREEDIGLFLKGDVVEIRVLPEHCFNSFAPSEWTIAKIKTMDALDPKHPFLFEYLEKTSGEQITAWHAWQFIECKNCFEKSFKNT